MRLGTLEIILILVVILLLFGARKIPELARGLGKGLREFRKAVKATDDSDDATASATGEPVNEKNKESNGD